MSNDSTNTISCSPRYAVKNQRSLAIFANGPSLNEAGIERLRGAPGLDLLAINTPHPSIPLNDYHYWLFVDMDVATRHADLVQQYEGTFISCLRLPTARHVMSFKLLRGSGFSRNICEGYYTGRSSTYVALQFAIEKQYKRIFVFGLDMNPVDGNCFFGPHADPHNAPAIRARRFEAEAIFLKFAAYDLTDAERSSIVLCGRAKDWDFCRYFERWPVEKAVSRILDSLSGVQARGE